MRFSLILVYAWICFAHTTNAQGPRQFGTEWQRLFNGKDLTGWQEIGHEKWVVEERSDLWGRRHQGIWILGNEEELYELPSVPAIQMRSERKQRSLYPHRVRTQHGQGNSRQAD